MPDIILEICSFSYQGCLNAELGGANRVELCSNPREGGTTPSYGLLKKVKENINLKVYPIIRPRGGDFYYSDEEFEVMLHDIAICKQLQCDGIATGVQKIDGRVDITQMKRLVEAAYPMGVTCIRSFDMVPDVFDSLEDIINSGCERVLTSGQAVTALEGSGLIRKLVDYAGDRIIIMAGGGIRAENIEELIRITNAKEFHASARINVPDNCLPESIKTFGFGNNVSCDVEQIKEMRRILDRMNGEV
jgi:copper homeostasis protein